MVSERDTGIGGSITRPAYSSEHRVADNQNTAVYHHGTGVSDPGSRDTVCSLAGL